MPTTPSPNMNMPVPVPGQEAGPTWAIDLTSCLAILDQHDHSSGSGVPITPDGLNINSDLTFANNNAINLRSVRFQTQVAPLALASDLGCIYRSGVDLYYNDGNGNQVRITQSGGIAGSPGSISGLSSPASAVYTSGNSRFTWQSGVNLAADMDFRSAILRNSGVSSFGLTLSPPLAMGSDFSLVLPSLPSNSNSKLIISTTGNITSNPASVLPGVTSVKTSTYTASSFDDLIPTDASGGAFPVNLPAASTYVGKILTLIKTDSSLNAVTIARAGSDTINGLTSTTLNSENETIRLQSDGVSKWYILDRSYPGGPTDYTPSLSGFGGAATPFKFTWWRRPGGMLIIGWWGTGTVQAAQARIALPTGATSSSSLPNMTGVGAALVGTVGMGTSLAGGTTVLLQPSQTYLTFGSQSGGAAGIVEANGNAAFSSSINYTLIAHVPIEGWN